MTNATEMKSVPGRGGPCFRFRENPSLRTNARVALGFYSIHFRGCINSFSGLHMAWRPVSYDIVHALGFHIEGLDSSFNEACARIGVVPISEIDRGYWGKSLGAIVETANGTRHWLKVFGVTEVDNANRLAEIRADEIVGIWKPLLITQHDWTDAGIHYTARLMTLANNSIERHPWAGMAAVQTPDTWIRDLMTTLNHLGSYASTGTFLKQRTLEDWLFARHHIQCEFPQGEWRLSHNDLHWGNVTAPILSILDWEWHGYSPVGYAPGRLIAFACRHDGLVNRLERAFEPYFASFTGLVARAYATERVMEGVRSGLFDPELEFSLGRMIDRLDEELHVRRPRT